MHELLFVLWFFLPAGIANAAPVVVAKLPGLKHWTAPLDGGRLFRQQPIFGKNKTWRGLLTGMMFSTLVLWLQQFAVAHASWAAFFAGPLDYIALPTLLLGPLFGFGALVGDAIESFFKRQRGVAPGHSWFPFDQSDYIVGGVLATLPIVQLSLIQYLLLLFVWLGMHMLFSLIGYLLHFKDKPI